MKFHLLFNLVAALGLAAMSAEARDLRETRVHFLGDDRASINDRITGYEAVAYHVHAAAGETMTVALETEDTSTYFNVYAPGTGPGDAAMAVSGQTGPMVPALNRFSAELPVSGDYVVTVYQTRASARRDNTAIYTLDVTLASGTAASAPATTRQGPPFWVVDVDTRLRIHDAPSVSAPVVANVLAGTALRNLGCERHEGRTWCQVERPGGTDRGWAAAEFLRGETGGLGAAGDAYAPYGHHNGWNILVRSEMGNGCVAETTRDGVQIQIGMNPQDRSTYLAIFTRENEGISEGDHMIVRFDLDGDRFIGDAITENRAGFEGGYIHVTNPAFLMDLAEKRTLTVMPAGRPPFSVDLTGSKAAIGRMIECQLHQP
mgnify:CR=1 FL=1